MTPKEFIENNISCAAYEIARYHLSDVYPKAVLKNDVPEYLLKQAEADLQHFEDIEKVRMEINKPLIGDAILRKDGSKTFIALFTYDGNFQDTHGGSFHVNGIHGSYSGGFTMDVLNTRNLQLTNELSELRCWIFSGKWVGGNRGVHYKINVRTWKEI